MESLFVNPWMLPALAAVVLPIVIEWLFRRRKRQVELPTIRFLLRSKEQQKVKRQDRILLLLRMAGILLLVLGICRPLLRQVLAGAKPMHVVVLLDATASMNQQVGVTTAFGLAQKRAGAMVRSLPKETAVSVVLLADRAEPLVEREKDLQTAAARIESLRAGAGAATMADGLAAVKALLGNPEEEQAEVYVFSDFQKHTWTGNATQTTATAQTMNEVAARGEVFLVDTGGEPQSNYLLTGLRPEEWLMSTGMPVRFHATVEAWNPAKDARATVTFLVGGVKKDVREVHPAEQPVGVVFEHRFTQPGEYLVEALLEGDEHRVDNRRSYLCTVPESVQVLVLDETATASSNGNGAAESFSGESAYLARALAPPTHPGMERVSRFSVKVIQPSQIDFENVEKYAAVVLADVAAPSETLAAKLESYVADGGAAWIFLGPRVNLYQYNKLLLKEGKGLLPCRLVSAGAEQKGGGSPPSPQPAPGGGPAAQLRLGDSVHPALAQLVSAGAADAQFLRWMEIEPQGDTRTVASLSTGTPAILERVFGRGRVLLSNFTAGVGWTYLPATPEYPILAQELLRHMAGNPDAAVNLNVGDRFEQPVYISTQHLLLRHPDGRKERLTPHKTATGGRVVAVANSPDARATSGRGFMVSFDGTRQQGVYEFVDAPPEVVPRTRFVVNQPPEEGDLTRLEPGAFADSFGRGRWNFIAGSTPLEDTVSRRLTVTEFAPHVLGALVFLLAVESLAAMRFGRRRGEVVA